ncbi:hypothetical protein CEXT_392551 [Caerostris extrusa]|uniref:Uncharacterized protein n=1 Tax=Caerostris extrusa TaxID=172846 RepID=A0AAV4WHS5_CAEEX|nr:hypothetical protein CEXT_392551 [Caerostris extrusa]
MIIKKPCDQERCYDSLTPSKMFWRVVARDETQFGIPQLMCKYKSFEYWKTKKTLRMITKKPCNQERCYDSLTPSKMFWRVARDETQFGIPQLTCKYKSVEDWKTKP